MSEDELRSRWQRQPMIKPEIDKVVVNISVGKSGEPLEKAAKVLGEITGHTPSRRRAKESIRDFNIRKGEAIAAMVTLRGTDAFDFLKKALLLIDNKLSASRFDRQGNFSFGLKEHIELPGVKYDPDVGIFGMDVCTTVIRPGYRVKHRHRRRARIGANHVLTPQESMLFIKNTFGVEIT